MRKIWDKVKVILDEMQLCIDWMHRKTWEIIFYWTIWCIKNKQSYWINWINQMVSEENIYEPTQEEIDLYYN